LSNKKHEKKDFLSCSNRVDDDSEEPSRLDVLRKYLKTLKPGVIKNTYELEKKLRNCWHELKGGDITNMDGYKILNRMERTKWNPPILSFTIERHGAMVGGSSRAELQLWNVDIEKGEAETDEYSEKTKEQTTFYGFY